ncbi:MAG: hypothetical protein WCP52_02670 [Bacteroidota bacterium]
MKKYFKIAFLISFALCSCNPTVDKKQYDLQVKFKDSLITVIKNQKTQIDSLNFKLDFKKSQIILESKAAPMTAYAFTNISNAILREYFKRNMKEGDGLKYPLLMKEVLINAFDASGYNYHATLHKLAQVGFTPNERAYVEIIIMPILSKKKEQYKEIYQGQELEDVIKILQIFKSIGNY